MSIPNDIIKYIILPLIPASFLSTCIQFNELSRNVIKQSVFTEQSKCLAKITIVDPDIVTMNDSFPNQILQSLVIATQNVNSLLGCIYTHDSSNCLTALIDLGVDITRYDSGAVLTYRSFGCLKIILGVNTSRYAMLVYIHAIRFEDLELFEVLLSSGKIKLTPGKLYAALIERKLKCYRWMLSKGVALSSEVFEYLISQDITDILDETLTHDASMDFKVNKLSTLPVHEFIGKSANMATARVLLKHGFDPSRWHKVAIKLASQHNMGTAIVFSNACDKSIKK